MKTLGKFKDEFYSLIIKEWLALNPKCYRINHQTLEDLKEVLKANEQKEIIEPIDPKDIIEKNKKTCKGIKAVVLKNEIAHQDYQNILETTATAKRDIISTRSFWQDRP